MANNKKLVEAITSMEDDFAQRLNLRVEGASSVQINKAMLRFG